MNSRDTVVTESRCAKCDADVRDASVFCYNCGARVADDPPSVEAAHVSDPVVESQTSAAKPAPGMRSARDLRRKGRSFERKPVQIVWEPAEDRIGFQLIVTALAFLAFTVIVLVLAFSLR